MQGFIQWDNVKYWPNEKGYEQYLLKEGDIVMAMDRPWVGNGFKMATIDKKCLPAILIQRTACIRSRGMKQEFLYAMLNSRWFARHCNVKGSLVPHISNKDIESYEIFVPPLDLQERFAAFVEQSDKSKFALSQALADLTATYKRIIAENLG